MAKRLKLTSKQKKQMLNTYKEQLDSMTLLDAVHTIKDSFKFDNKKKPIIKFSEKARLIIKELVKQCSKEIAWNGLVNYDKDTNTYEVYDILIFPQIVTGTSVDVDETKYAMWLASLTNEQLEHMRFHGHSHVHMAVRPSGVDTGYQKEMLNMQIKDYYIFMIFNKSENMYACIYDVAGNAFYEDDDIIIEEDSALNPYVSLVEDWIDKYVTFPVAQPTPYRFSYGYGNVNNIQPTQYPSTQPTNRGAQAVLEEARKHFEDNIRTYTD